MKVVEESKYKRDPLDRVIEQNERHKVTESPSARTTQMTYVGLTNDLSTEKRRNGFTTTAQLQKTKAYSYDASGNRIAMVDTPQSGTDPKTYTYGRDVHGNTSMLLNTTTSATTVQVNRPRHSAALIRVAALG